MTTILSTLNENASDFAQAISDLPSSRGTFSLLPFFLPSPPALPPSLPLSLPADLPPLFLPFFLPPHPFLIGLSSAFEASADDSDADDNVGSLNFSLNDLEEEEDL